MNKIEKRLLNLAIGEFAALCAFIFVFRTLNLGMASLIGFSYLIIILLQGSLYWSYRYILLIRKESTSLYAIKILRVLRHLNMILIVVITILMSIISSKDNDLLIGIGLFLFGIVEYINYYWYRLSYGKSGFNIRILLGKKLQKSSINKLISK
ncbi:hypothetical protein Desdi_0709 [Desulfitobacterium dichloroeliminans LMG P-21439]|uniref:Uncharacterized protein n=1 Tax=Desulfitobacterium dichloroeliminans (strain LMG P-21439 / DCA1) TaxID=871963 RepID=L0F6F1_DESDL|nr:hypothetical protein [Desulfitobacterium dichloroeliminans]AGA68236.1 hypothetical protein Desdi_0709 [Desulfitobacterium dichloroeliminans LMG P-21439]